MAKTKSTEPVVIVGSHSVRTEYPDGRVEFVSDWDKLKADVEAALASVADEKPKKASAKVKKAVEKVVEKIAKPAKKTAPAKKAVAKKPPAKKTATKSKKTK